jgi:hypothetical protein
MKDKMIDKIKAEIEEVSKGGWLDDFENGKLSSMYKCLEWAEETEKEKQNDKEKKA